MRRPRRRLLAVTGFPAGVLVQGYYGGGYRGGGGWGRGCVKDKVAWVSVMAVTA